MVDAAPDRHGECEGEQVEGERGGAATRGAAHWLRRGAAAAAVVAAVAGAVVWAGSGRSQGIRVLGASRSALSGQPSAMPLSAYMDPNDNGQLEYRSADTSGLGFAGGGDPYKYIETGHYAKELARENEIQMGWHNGTSGMQGVKQALVKQALASIHALAALKRVNQRSTRETQLYESGQDREREEAKKLNLLNPLVGRVQTGQEIESAGMPMRPGGLGVWLGRGEVPDDNVWTENYLDTKMNEHYGQTAVTQHAWSPLPDYATPNGHYYNVLDHWTPTDPMAPPNQPTGAGR